VDSFNWWVTKEVRGFVTHLVPKSNILFDDYIQQCPTDSNIRQLGMFWATFGTACPLTYSHVYDTGQNLKNKANTMIHPSTQGLSQPDEPKHGIK